MGILAEIFVSTPEDAPGYESARLNGGASLNAFVDRAEYKGLTGLEFGTLWAIISNQEWTISHQLESIAMSSGGESWLDRFPNDLVSKLATMDNDGKTRAAKMWAATEELRCSPTDLLPILADLHRLALKAQGSSRSLYLWGSL